MSEFRAAVHEIVSDGLRSLTPPCQGYIPAGGIDKDTNTCTVRIPNHHGGLQPGGGAGSYIELKAVPIPFYYKGVLGGILDLVSKGDRGVIVGFKGHNMANPYIVSPLPAAINTDKPDQTVKARTPVTASRAANIGGSHTVVTPNTLSQNILQVKTFDELLSPGDLPGVASSVDPNKLSLFQQTQTSLKDQISSATSRLSAPSVVGKK